MKRLSLLSIVLVSGSALATVSLKPTSLSGAATAESRASALAEVNDFIARLAHTASYGLDSNYNDLLNNLRDLEQNLEQSRALLLKSGSNGENQVCGDVASSIKEARKNFRDIVDKLQRIVNAAKNNETIIKSIYDRIESGKKSAASAVIDGINKTAAGLSVIDDINKTAAGISSLADHINELVYNSKKQEARIINKLEKESQAIRALAKQ